MKLALEVALGVVLGGLALEGLHECQRIVRNHLEQDAQPANITTHHTLNPDADQRTAPRQDSLRGYPTFAHPPTPGELEPSEALADEAERAAGYTPQPRHIPRQP